MGITSASSRSPKTSTGTGSRRRSRTACCVSSSRRRKPQKLGKSSSKRRERRKRNGATSISPIFSSERNTDRENYIVQEHPDPDRRVGSRRQGRRARRSLRQGDRRQDYCHDGHRAVPFALGR